VKTLLSPTPPPLELGGPAQSRGSRPHSPLLTGRPGTDCHRSRVPCSSSKAPPPRPRPTPQHQPPPIPRQQPVKFAIATTTRTSPPGRGVRRWLRRWEWRAAGGGVGKYFFRSRRLSRRIQDRRLLPPASPPQWPPTQKSHFSPPPASIRPTHFTLLYGRRGGDMATASATTAGFGALLRHSVPPPQPLAPPARQSPPPTPDAQDPPSNPARAALLRVLPGLRQRARPPCATTSFSGQNSSCQQHK